MKDYRMLAVRYLKMNLRRSEITVFGVIVTTILLFVMLNLGVSFLLAERESIRETTDYEMVLFVDTEEQITAIIADTRIRTAYVGPYSYYTYTEDGPVTTTCDQALYINLKNPYRMRAVFDSLCSTYGLEGEINYGLAEAYLQMDDANGILVFGLAILLVSFIFAIFGVGIVRNSIQLCILESIRDYGNLRCVGAAKGQLRAIIYMQGAVLELTGIAGGVIIGTIISMIIGAILHMAAGFHILPVIFILIVFLGDLYFAMQENCKLVVNMTPVSAIRGEYRIQKEKLKLRKNKLVTKFLGVDGEYAYKSIMRNPKRFFRTVGSLVFGVGALIAIVSFTSQLNYLITEWLDEYGYYQLYFESILMPNNTITEIQSFLPPTELMEQLIEQEEITEGKRMYVSKVLFTDYDEMYNHYSEEYRESSLGLESRNEFWKREYNLVSYLTYTAGISCYGYDETDYERYQSVLMDGTLDVSENGIVILNQVDISYSQAVLNDDDLGVVETQKRRRIPIMDYQVGDRIDIVDMKELRDRIHTEQEQLWSEYQEEQQRLYEQEWSSKEERDDALDERKKEYVERIQGMVYDCWEELIAEGRYHTYTIEGIVSKDVNHYYSPFGTEDFRIILPLERYFDITGTDETMVTGMQYHMDYIPKNQRLFSMLNYNQKGWEPGVEFSQSFLPFILEELDNWRKPLYFVLVFTTFIIVMSALNIINATISNLHLRKKEFAQLRVIGVSKKRLMRMVMLEGVMTAVTADGIGILLGVGVAYGLNFFISLILFSKFHFPIGIIAVCVLATVLLLCGSIYVSLKDMKQNMAEDLKAGGD